MKPQRIGETHSFQVEIAVQVGIEKAILLKEIYGWCHMNLARQKNVFSGIPFSYNPARAFAEKFPYMKQKSVARWLKELEDEQWIYTENFNQNAYDRTKWYTIDFGRYDAAIKGEEYVIGTWSEYVKSISQNEEWKSQNDTPKSQNETTIPSPTHTTITSSKQGGGDFSKKNPTLHPPSESIYIDKIETPNAKRSRLNSREEVAEAPQGVPAAGTPAHAVMTNPAAYLAAADLLHSEMLKSADERVRAIPKAAVDAYFSHIQKSAKWIDLILPTEPAEKYKWVSRHTAAAHAWHQRDEKWAKENGRTSTPEPATLEHIFTGY